MPERRRGERRNRLIDAVAAAVEPQSYQRHPYFPDLLHQPDPLMIPERGKLIVVFVYQLKRRLGWGSAPARLEDLIEVKLSVGDYCLVCAFVTAELEELGSPG